MYQESHEKVLSDVEKHDFSRVNRIFQSKLINKFLSYLMIVGLVMMVLFGVVYFERFLNSREEVIFSSRKHSVSLANSDTNLKKLYEPVITNRFPQFDDYIAKSIVVYDISANQIIYEKNSNEQYLIASLTKLASIKVLSDKLNENNPTVITEDAAKFNGSNLQFKAGDIYTNRDLFKASIIASNNQALYAFQEPSKTVDELNNYAKTLRLQKTFFRNPAGFDDDGGNFSTSRELISISLAFFDNPKLKDYAGTYRTEIREINSGTTTLMTNTNDLLRNENFPVIAGKTGTTFRAGQNLVLLVEKNSRRYLIILMASTDRYNDAIKILGRI